MNAATTATPAESAAAAAAAEIESPSSPHRRSRPAPHESPPQPPLPAATSSSRILGYDVARAVAICGMVVDHSAQVIGPADPAGWGQTLLDFMDGRASAVFVVLAGVGVSLLCRKHAPADLRRTLLRRGALLLAIGFVNQAIWPGDILRTFGVAIMLAGFLVPLGSRALLAVAAAIVLAFPALWLTVDYDAHWNWGTMHYANLWRPAGIVRNLFYDGFRPVIPWAGLLVLGMWIGRLDVTRAAVRRRMFACGVGMMLAVEIGSRVILSYALAHRGGVSESNLRDWLETGSMPPLPLFVLTTTGWALAVIALGLAVGVRRPQSTAVRALVATGQLALTWYVGHILLGAVLVHFAGWHRFDSLPLSLLAGVSLFTLMVLTSALAKRRWRTGPMEWLLRRAG